MLGVSKMTPGGGYLYFERQIASGDQPRPRGPELADYHQDAGLPPGVWVGRAAALLGVHGAVTEAQMLALFGEGLHPLADDMTADLLRAGASVKKTLQAVRLGTSYYGFGQSPTDLARRIEARVTAFEAQHDQPPTESERRLIRAEEGAIAFRTEFGREPSDAKELARFVRRRSAPARQPVAAWHFVAQAPPSIVLLWALGDEATRRAVEQCHDHSVAMTIRWIEDHALATRSGTNGIAQHDVTTGLIGVKFRHFDSRAGDPGLHDHILVANKVQNPQGKWRAIDGRHLLAQTVTASEVYNAEMMHRTCTALGLRAEERPTPGGRRPVMEIAGISDDMVEVVTRRSHAIRDRLEQLTDTHRAEHGKEPGQATRIKLAKRATLETRPAKKQVLPLADLRSQWRERAIDTFGQEAVDGLLASARSAARRLAAGLAHSAPEQSSGAEKVGPRADIEAPRVDVAALANAVVEAVSAHRAVFARHHLRAEANRQITRAGRGTLTPSDWAEQITDYATARLCLDLTPPDLATPLPELQRADGTSVYRHRGAQLYTTPALLAAEDAIVAAARTVQPPPCTSATFEYQRFRFDGRLDAGQIALARAFATGSQQLIAAIGPAGAGKTTALRLAVAALTAAGRRVVALAPSARAAHVLGEELAGPAHTIHHWLHRQQSAGTGKRPRDEAETLRPGDTVIIDEAGMASTLHLATVVARATTAGAHVRLVGDPAQLASVESGGVLRLLQSEVGAVHLTAVHRFLTPGERDASLRLRDGDPGEAFTWYRTQQRLRGGPVNDMLDAALAAWQTDLAAGRTSVLAAPTRETASALNSRAQKLRLAAGELQAPDHRLPLSDGHEAHIGDTVVTRRNDRRRTCLRGKDFVKNGDTWTVESRTATGGAVVRHTQHGGRLTLPATYLAHHTELGYAATVHRIQGMTVDTLHAVLTSGLSREAAYVAATRGRHANHLYVALNHGETLDAALRRIATSTDQEPTARQTIGTSQQEAQGIARLVAEYADVSARADEQRYRNAFHTVLGNAGRDLATQEIPASAIAFMAGAEAAGIAPCDAIALAHHANPHQPIFDLLRNPAGAASTTRTAHPDRPLSYSQCRFLRRRAVDRRAAALAELGAAQEELGRLPAPITVEGRTRPAWPHRPHGHLSAEQLATARSGRPTTGEATLTALHEEQHLRTAMNPKDRTREDEQRRQAALSRQLSSAHHHALRSAAHDRLDTARQDSRHAVINAARLDLETRLRNRSSERPARTSDTDDDLPQWLAPTGALRDPLTPAAWRRHLQQRRQAIDDHLTIRGNQLAAAPPMWTHALGPVPTADAGEATRTRWERTAALAEALRTLHHVPERAPGIGPEPTDVAAAAAWQQLDVRITSHANRTSHHAPGTVLVPAEPPSPSDDAEEAELAAAATAAEWVRHIPDPRTRTTLTNSTCTARSSQPVNAGA
ncbi:conjugative relaxase-like TrwC/TraI family protein [Streptomyces sp. TLI_235]|nr:conjugative relaxase-like TrwC/TraI family protein [Streptomyces sp. TLI_235]